MLQCLTLDVRRLFPFLQVHERDRFSDFLLTVLRDALNKFRNLKLIIMSATADVQMFS
jgi:HrpA-like RNA helicase